MRKIYHLSRFNDNAPYLCWEEMFVSANGRSDKILNSPLYTYFIINDKGTRAKKGRAILQSTHSWYVLISEVGFLSENLPIGRETSVRYPH